MSNVMSGGNKMTNFEKFKQELTVERLASMLAATYCERVWEACNYCEACDYCAYDSYTCANDCKYGIKKFLESEVKI